MSVAKTLNELLKEYEEAINNDHFNMVEALITDELNKEDEQFSTFSALLNAKPKYNSTSADAPQEMPELYNVVCQKLFDIGLLVKREKQEIAQPKKTKKKKKQPENAEIPNTFSTFTQTSDAFAVCALWWRLAWYGVVLNPGNHQFAVEGDVAYLTKLDSNSYRLLVGTNVPGSTYLVFPPLHAFCVFGKSNNTLKKTQMFNDEARLRERIKRVYRLKTYQESDSLALPLLTPLGKEDGAFVKRPSLLEPRTESERTEVPQFKQVFPDNKPDAALVGTDVYVSKWLAERVDTDAEAPTRVRGEGAFIDTRTFQLPPEFAWMLEDPSKTKDTDKDPVLQWVASLKTAMDKAYNEEPVDELTVDVT